MIEMNLNLFHNQTVSKLYSGMALFYSTLNFSIRDFILSFIFLIAFFSSNLFAKTELSPTEIATSKANVQQHFDHIIQNIDNTLIAEQKKLKTDIPTLETFVKSNILVNWNVELTLKQLIGKKHWKKLKPEDIQSLKSRFEQTLQRYVREGMDYYDGQRVTLTNVEINKKNTRGLVTIQLEPLYLPSFSVTFKIAHKNSQWQLYDVLVEGISYVKMKKQQYRRLVEEQGVNGLLAYLDQKNTIDAN